MRATNFIGMDVHKNTISIAVASSGSSEVRDHGVIPNTENAVKKIVSKLSQNGDDLVFCYEAGCCGYVLHRQIQALGHDCLVVAPALIPMKPGERVKTDKRDATRLARLLRAGELTPVWVPDDEHEAIRDLLRSRTSAVKTCTQAKNRLNGFLLRHGHAYPDGKKRWGYTHKQWIHTCRFPCIAQEIVVRDCLSEIERCEERCAMLDKELESEIQKWSLLPYVEAFKAMKGVSTLTAITLAAEAGDFTRFHSASAFMAYVGLVPSEYSSGGKTNRGHITRTGNCHLRRVLVEASWTYKRPPQSSARLFTRDAHLPQEIKDIAWKAQLRLHRRFNKMTGLGNKKSNVAAVAVAREMAGFIWAIGRVVAEDLNS